MESMAWTPELLQSALTVKQKKLSEVMNLKPDIEESFDRSEKAFECKEAELKLLYELDTNGDRLSDPKINAKVLNTKEYQELWEDYISSKSILRKCKMEIAVLNKEMDTIENIGMLIMSEMKHFKNAQNTDNMGRAK